MIRFPTTLLGSTDVLASGSQIDVSASDLSKERVYSWMCRPVVADYRFLGHAGLSLLMDKVRSTPTHRLAKDKAFTSLQMTAQCGLNRPSATETAVTKYDLLALLTYVKNRSTKAEHLAVGPPARTLPGSFAYRFASKKSESDSVLTAQRGDNSIFGLIGGEVKGELDSLFCALPQAIQIACDFLFHAVHVLQLSVTEVAIPFVVVAGGEVQFGAVYSLEHEFYPVPILMTPPLSLNFLDAVYSVLEGLVDYVDNHLMSLPVERLMCNVKPPSLLRLNRSRYFLKPLQLFINPYVYAHGRLHRLLAVWLFDKLFACEALRSIVVFPVGFIGFPGRHDPVRGFLGDVMIERLETSIGKQLIDRVRVAPFEKEEIAGQKRKASSSDRQPSKRRNPSDVDRNANGSDRTASEYEDTPGSLPSGFPIVVYPRLGSPWRMAGTTDVETGVSEVYVPETHREAFYGKVRDAVGLMARAGVCHLDIGLSNVFFRVEDDEVQIKLIDFDFAHAQDHVFPKLFTHLISHTINAYPRTIDEAGDAWQRFMLRALRDALGLEVTDDDV